MYKITDLPIETQDCVLSFIGFVRGRYDILPYDELLHKFMDGTGITEDLNSYHIVTEGDCEDYFDFDYGVLGGTFSNQDGKANLDCFQWYCYNPETGEVEVYDLTTKNI